MFPKPACQASCVKVRGWLWTLLGQLEDSPGRIAYNLNSPPGSKGFALDFLPSKPPPPKKNKRSLKTSSDLQSCKVSGAAGCTRDPLGAKIPIFKPHVHGVVRVSPD